MAKWRRSTLKMVLAQFWSRIQIHDLEISHSRCLIQIENVLEKGQKKSINDAFLEILDVFKIFSKIPISEAIFDEKLDGDVGEFVRVTVFETWTNFV